MVDSIQEREHVVPITRDELRRRLDLESALLNAPLNKTITEIVEDKTASLLEEKGRFKHVFKTEKGSLYFVLEDGAVQRIKLADKINPVQDLHNYLFFISSDTVHELINNPRLKEVLDQEGVPVVPLQEGAHPMDFGKRDSSEDKFDLLDQRVHIHGNESGFIHGFHVGNAITEVIK